MESLLLLALSPVVLHIIGAVAVFVVVAYITSDRNNFDRYVPMTQDDNRNAYRRPIRPPAWWRGNSGRRGVVGAVIFVIIYPIYSYNLWEDNPALAVLLCIFALLSTIFTMVTPNTIPYMSPAGGFWALVCASVGWIGSNILERAVTLIETPNLLDYESTPWGWVTFWIFAAFTAATLNVFFWTLLLRALSMRNESWFVRLLKPGEGVVVGYAGHYVRIICNLPDHMVAVGIDHHHPHIPLPLCIDPTRRDVVYDWIQFGAHGLAQHGIQMVAANGRVVDLHHFDDGTWRQRVSQAVGVVPDSRAMHTLPAVACLGVPVFSELIALPGGDHGHHEAHGGHGHEAPQANYRFAWGKRTDNFTTQPVANRAGTAWKVKIGFQAFMVFPERGNNTVDPHAAVHQWWDHIGGFLATNGHRLLGRLGGIEELEHRLGEVTDEWMMPDMPDMPALVGVLHMMEHVQMAILADTGEAVVNVAVEDVDMPEELSKLLQLALALHFQTNPALMTRRSDALRDYVKAEMGGVLQAMRDNNASDDAIDKAAVEAASKFFLRGTDMVLWGNVNSAAGMVPPGTGKKGTS